MPGNTDNPFVLNPPNKPMEDLLHKLCSKGNFGVKGAQLVPLTQGAPEVIREDSAMRASLVDGNGSPAGVLFLSNSTAPKIAQRSSSMAADAKSKLSPKLSLVILEPLAEGDFEGRSYVYWPFCQPLRQSRYLAFAQRKYLTRSLLSWLFEMTRQTIQLDAGQEINRAQALSLECLAADVDFPVIMRDSAKRGLDRLADGKWRPVFVFEHGDFWMGNILWPHKERGTFARMGRYPFTLIDWNGARASGYPMFDLVRFGVSIGYSSAAMRKELIRHCQILGYKLDDAQFSVLAAMGHLGANLEHFPREQYLRMGSELFEAVVAATE
jgi:hypothetical protein